MDDYDILTEEDLAAFVPYECIVGNLSVRHTHLEDVNLPNLEWVGGDLIVGDNYFLVSLGLGSLVSVTGTDRSS
jgi:hypothetical protein